MKPTTVFGNARIWNETDKFMRVKAGYDYKMIVGEKVHAFSLGNIDSMFEIPRDSEFTLDIDGEGVLHKFRGLQYLGEEERKDGFKEKLKEMLIKIRGAIVVVSGSATDVIFDGKVVSSGCSEILDVIGPENMKDVFDRPGHPLFMEIDGDSVSTKQIGVAKSYEKIFLDAYERIMK